jgi:amidase
LLDLYLTRIDQRGPPINAVVTLERDRAYVAAARADDAAARGDWLGPLHGLPITIKDAIEVASVRSIGGATELTDHIPTVAGILGAVSAGGYQVPPGFLGMYG